MIYIGSEGAILSFERLTAHICPVTNAKKKIVGNTKNSYRFITTQTCFRVSFLYPYNNPTQICFIFLITSRHVRDFTLRIFITSGGQIVLKFLI